VVKAKDGSVSGSKGRWEKGVVNKALPREARLCRPDERRSASLK